MNARTIVQTAGLPIALACIGAAAALAPVRLPTEWSIAPAAGPVLALGTQPSGIALSADGKRAAVVEAGAGVPGVRIVNLADLSLERFIPLASSTGRPLWDRSGDGLWVAGGNSDKLFHVRAGDGAIDRTVAFASGSYPAAIARSERDDTLAVALESSEGVAIVAPDGTITATAGAGSHPIDLAWSPDGTLIYAALWGESAVARIERASARTVKIATGLHPEALLLSPDGRTLYVADADDDTVSIVDTATQRRTDSVDVGFFRHRVYGASPNALAFAPDGSHLYVACSAANAIAVVNLSALQAPAQALPAGWFPTAIAFDAQGRLLIANAKGEGSHANPEYEAFVPHSRHPSISRALLGSLRRLDLAGTPPLPPERVAELGGPYLAQAVGQAATLHDGPPSSEPGRAIVRANGPIKHVIYIIKENRTYDQVLGDVAAGDGDARLVLFGQRVTPNQHALADRFGLFDRTFADAQVSADGHNWSTAAYANDYTSKMWPPLYGNRRKVYDFEDGVGPPVPHGGYLWDAAARAGISYRDYGEFAVIASKAAGAQSEAPNLKGHIDPRYPGFDLAITDRARADEWRSEFRDYERSGTLPALEIVKLPGDHTAGTKTGRRTPEAFVADNDYAFGTIVDAVSHSRYWKDTAIFAIEDDAQDGADHVDEQRTTFYVASAYAAPGVHHAHYSTAGVVRTIELILGMEPMSAYDASALPLYAAFRAQPDLRPFRAIVPAIDLNAVNKATAYRSAESAKLDLDGADRVDPQTMNAIVWGAVKRR